MSKKIQIRAVIAYGVCPLLILFILNGCGPDQKPVDGPDQELRRKDSLTELAIDSAYASVKADCEEKKQFLPWIADSVCKDLKGGKITDSILMAKTIQLLAFNDSMKRLSPVERPGYEKLNKVTVQLLADCDSTLARETYILSQALLRKELSRKQPVKNRRG